MHVYDVYDNDLTEFYQPPKETRSVFQDLKIGFLESKTLSAIQDTENAFSLLETDTQTAVNGLLERTVWSGESYTGKKSLPCDRRTVETLRKYFVFLRFRNSEGYRQTVRSLEASYQSQPQDGNIYPAFRPLIVQNRLRFILKTFVNFFQHMSSGTSAKPNPAKPHPEQTVPEGTLVNAFGDMMNLYCWRMCDAELCIGVATEDQEFMLSDRCFGSLDEGFDEHP